MTMRKPKKHKPKPTLLPAMWGSQKWGSHKGEIASDQMFEFYDRAPWLDDDRNARWYNAFNALDEYGDKEPLLSLLRATGVKLDGHLADLLDRHIKPKPRGAPRIPSYDRSPVETILHLALEEVRRYVATGKSVKDALAKAAKGYGVDENALALAYQGKRGSSQRMRRRRPPA